ncbi:tripartite tricarboxylate transporter substrate binding protein [uncultured Xylophilus sp.]|uniref:tripartite tricarboxylate transporter substrate binding protein n=1 Tax=uncultured Xylophilus sp. TaxID=296832 RepID=UPI0025EA1781|nr:tripartite tricarboxylate transporter substrate binding protein [uncultured Xylophilus sp.]
MAYPPGGVSDLVARALAAQVGGALGGPIVVEHRGGAGGAVALQALARAVPDGRTLCFCAISPLAAPPGLPRPAWAAAVVPVIAVVRTPTLLVATPAFPAGGLADVLAAARSRPGALRWATTGTGTVGHQVLEAVCRAAGIAVTHVPYRGGGAQLQDAVGGQFELLSTNVGPLQLDHLRAGRLRALAVGAPQRVALLPAVATFAESGMPGADRTSLFGIFAPPGTPPAVRDRLHRVFAEALDQPALRRRIVAGGNLVAGGSAQAFADEIARQPR